MGAGKCRLKLAQLFHVVSSAGIIVECKSTLTITGYKFCP